MNVPLLNLKRHYEYMKKEIDTAIEKCLDHQSWILGPEVKEFEKRCAEYLGIKHCITCSSGTDALVIALRSFAIKKGKEFFNKEDEIITTPFTFTATGDAILRAGATPVFIDIEPDTLNLNPELTQKYLDLCSGNVKSILPVHLYGTPCEIKNIKEISKKQNFFIVEDVAQAFGGSYENKKLGTIGDAGAFSFFPSKNLGGFGDGGMISTDDDEIAEIARCLTKHGGKDKYNVDYIGYNARLDTIQAAILLVRLKYLEEFNSRRIELSQKYDLQLSQIEGIKTPCLKEGAVFHQYTIRVLNGKRNLLQNFLKEKNVSTMVYYPVCLHKMKVFEGRSKMQGKLLEAEKATEEVLSIPIDPLMTENEQNHVIDSIKEFFKDA